MLVTNQSMSPSLSKSAGAAPMPFSSVMTVVVAWSNVPSPCVVEDFARAEVARDEQVLEAVVVDVGEVRREAPIEQVEIARHAYARGGGERR
jgi:hypothetical protein